MPAATSPRKGSSSSRPLPLGVDDREGARHSMPVTAPPFQRFLLWDGRADSLWSQPLRAIEAEAEMDFTRVEVARFVGTTHRAGYEAVFGPLPDVAELPERARPGLPAWEQMTAGQKDQVTSRRGRGAPRRSIQRPGACSDDPEAGRALLDSIAAETGSMGAFRTAGLRGAGQRQFFGHRGHEEFLSDFIDDVYDDPHLHGGVGELDAEAADLGVTRPGGLASFLQMLDCPPLPPELLEP